MDTLMETIASNAVLATLIALAVAALTRLVRRPELAYWLWMLVLVKLVTPPIVSMPLRLGGTAEPAVLSEDTASMEDVSPAAHPERRPRVAMPVAAAPKLPPVDETLADQTSSGSAAVEVSEHAAQLAPTPDAAPADGPATAAEIGIQIPWSAVAAGVWLGGSIFWFALAAIRLFRFGQLVRGADAAPEYLQAAARQLAERFGLRRCPEVRVVRARIPPLLWWSGRRAVIVLPRGLLGQLGVNEQTSLLAHDLAHLRRGDHLVRWAEALILGLYWWHPVVWWARRRLRQAEEQCCDAWVVWAFPGDAKSYAHTLLTAVEFLSVSRPAVPAVAAGLEQIGSLKRRLEMILKRPVRRRLSWAGVTAVVMVALAVLPWSARTVPAQAAEDDAEKAAAKEAVEAETAETGAPSVDAPSPPRQMAGVVLGPDGAPLAGAKVYLVGNQRNVMFGRALYSPALPQEQQVLASMLKTFGSTRTDAAGRFTLDAGPANMPDDHYADIVVLAEGLGLVCLDWEATDAEMKIQVPKMVPIRGRLLGPDGSPAAGVHVRPLSIYGKGGYLHVSRALPEEDLPEFWPRPVRTDADGSFTLKGVSQDWSIELQLSHPDYAHERLRVNTGLRETETSEEKEAEEETDEKRLPATFTHRIGPPRPVEGVVTAADTGKPLAGVLIEVIPMGRRGGRAIHGRTDDQGHYRINTHDARHYWIDVYPVPDSGYLAAERYYDRWPEGAESLVQDFALRRGKLIRGRVLDDETEKPLAGASVVYRPSRANPYREEEYEYDNPTLTDEEGRFALTAISGSGYLMVETADRGYVRTPLADTRRLDRPMPTGYTPIDVPAEGTLDKDVVIRLKRGRTVALQAVGPDGEKLPSVRAVWEGIDAVHDMVWNTSESFPQGSVVVRGLDPGRTVRVFLINTDRKLGAVLDITPETPGGPIEVRLQPTATIVGQMVTPEGTPDPKGRADLKMSFDPDVTQFLWDREHRTGYEFYSNFTRKYGEGDPPYPEGKFALEYVVPGLPLGLSIGQMVDDRGWRTLDLITVGPLEPGVRHDVGKLVVQEKGVAELEAAVPVQPFKEATSEGGELKYIQGIPVLFVQGEPEQIGSQYATLLADVIRPAVGVPKTIMGIFGANGVWSTMVKQSRGLLNNVPQRHRREIDAALEAIQASQAETEALLVANGMIEIYGTGDSAAFLVEPARSATGGMLFGRKLDLYTYGVLDRLSLVTIRRAKGRHAFASVGYAGAVAIMAGMNDAGLALATLDSYSTKDDSPKFDPQGTPVHSTTVRILEECTTVEEAEKLVKSIKHASRRNLVVCDARRAVVFEITSKNVVTRGAEDHLLACTNHFRTPELSVSTKCKRYETLQKNWQTKDPFAWSDVAEALHEAGEGTLHTMIFEPESLTLRVAIGQPATPKSLVTLNLAELFQHKVAAAAER